MASDVYPPGVPCWIAMAAPEPESAAAFYGGVFGWEPEDRTPPGSASPYLVARLRGHDVAGVTAQDGAGSPAPAWVTYVCVESAAESSARAVAAGGHVVAEPFDVPGAGRGALLADPAGAVFGVWEPAGRRGAQLVNAPGTWNFSDLVTADPDGATAFYRAVFGWQARPVQLGGETATMWCLPGYGEVQDAKEPGFLRRHAESGTPEGFADAFGWLLPAAPDSHQAGRAARWVVTFAVDDVDAVAGQAAQLGGAVAVAPYDAGPARVAVLTDPWGASFTVSAYQPAT